VQHGKWLDPLSNLLSEMLVCSAWAMEKSTVMHLVNEHMAGMATILLGLLNSHPLRV
jgi:hypothetical protein